jgi:GT2 family glycosyltransferase
MGSINQEADRFDNVRPRFPTTLELLDDDAFREVAGSGAPGELKHRKERQALRDIGVVIIGRNEGERLLRCLASIPDGVRRSVYVDSGSTDGSVQAAQARGVEVLNLDLSVPFTAARARNAGWQQLLRLEPDLKAILFIDGDCEIVGGFPQAAAESMATAPDIVAVCGVRRERWPDRTPYNALCDVEWRSGPIGEARSFGGDVLIRTDALVAVGGYDDSVIAAEDDELGARLRRKGGRIVRLAVTSTIHDAAMRGIGQWWQRAKRCGHAYAQVFDKHGAPPERYFATEIRRVVVWGMVVPTTAVVLAVPTMGLSLGLFGIYPVKALRTFQDSRRRGFTVRESVLWGTSCTAAKLPEAVGVLTYHFRGLMGRRPTIIEYKAH